MKTSCHWPSVLTRLTVGVALGPLMGGLLPPPPLLVGGLLPPPPLLVGGLLPPLPLLVGGLLPPPPLLVGGLPPGTGCCTNAIETAPSSAGLSPS